MSAPTDYLERVYAGLLGKCIGIYAGHPFELWGHDRIVQQLGEINYYVNDHFNSPVVTTDDDLGGMLTFLRAIPDYGYSKEVTAEQIGKTWLNYLVEDQTVLWWGGRGISTEHTAYLNLKAGIPAPASGSIKTNGHLVAEQIGSQIFIDGWAMIAPGDPDLAASLARRAASVSHDGEAIYGAQIVSVIEAMAFVEPDINTCLDTALRYIPADSIIASLICEVREWHAKEPDWHLCLDWLNTNYGYDRFRGACHIMPNHGAIIMSLLYGDDNFQKSLMIANTSGLDTDCNAGNVGCFLGIKNGLAGIEEDADWRGPVSDRIYLGGGDCGRAITDAVRESYEITNIYRRMNGMEALNPKNGARFHFEMPGSVQGFRVEASETPLNLKNVSGHSLLGERSLALQCNGLQAGKFARTATPTFIPEEFLEPSQDTSHPLVASPSLYSGQTVQAWVSTASDNSDSVICRLDLRIYGVDDRLEIIPGSPVTLAPGQASEISWTVPDTGGHPIADVGVGVSSLETTSATVYLDALTWTGEPRTTLANPEDGSSLWQRAWTKGVNSFMPVKSTDPDNVGSAYLIAQNHGRGLLLQGSRDWRDYRVVSRIAATTGKAFGLAARAQGMHRFYALLLEKSDRAVLVRVYDDNISRLAESAFEWVVDINYTFDLQIQGNMLRAGLNGVQLFEIQDDDTRLDCGAIAYLVDEACVLSASVEISPVV
jgi:ADP-ribosylglycohydrolase